MTDKEILTKAIFKAINNGYKKDNNKLYLIARGNIKSTLSIEFYRTLIFDHDFAKAFWGEKTAWNMDTCSDCNYAKKNISCAVCDRYNPGWQSYLQTMVLQTEPLKYLEKFL